MSSTFIIGFLLGFIACAALQYAMQLFTDHQRGVAAAIDKENELDLLFETHADFFSRLKKDVEDPLNANVREFFVVDKDAIMSSSIPRFRYDLSDEIINILDQLDELEYIERIPNDSLLYRMEEEFVEELKSMSIQTASTAPGQDSSTFDSHKFGR